MTEPRQAESSQPGSRRSPAVWVARRQQGRKDHAILTQREPDASLDPTQLLIMDQETAARLMAIALACKYEDEQLL